MVVEDAAGEATLEGEVAVVAVDDMEAEAASDTKVPGGKPHPELQVVRRETK